MSLLKNVTTESFHALVEENEKPVLVDFYADWCGPCQAQTPILESIADRYADSVDVFKLDIDSNKELVKKFDIRGIPTVLYFKNSKLVESRRGLSTAQDFAQLIEASA